MGTAPHRDDDDNDNDNDNHNRNHGDEERARIENAAARLRVPVATLRYWRTHDRLRRAERGRRPGSGPIGS